MMDILPVIASATIEPNDRMTAAGGHAHKPPIGLAGKRLFNPQGNGALTSEPSPGLMIGASSVRYRKFSADADRLFAFQSGHHGTWAARGCPPLIRPAPAATPLKL